ncbi:MAG: glycosyltransferase 87 family protein [Pseudomonadota bacterium]
MPTDIVTDIETKQSDWPAVLPLASLGILIILGFGAIAVLSHDFPYGRDPSSAPTRTYIALAAALGGGCLLLVPIVRHLTPTKNRLLLLLAVGLLARLFMFASDPVLEDDWHRYLWDGASVAHGVDPYKYAPAEATPVTRLGEKIGWSEEPDLARLQEMTDEAPILYWRINYPYLKTIYPPIAQLAFAAAHFVSPYSLTGWRAVLLVVDLLTVALLAWTLTLFGRSPLWAGLYWWNPVVILEAFNAGHMDVLIAPALVGVLALARLGKLKLAVMALAAASAVKFWPALLAPALIRKHLFNPLHVAGFAALFIAAALVLLWPQLRYIFVDPDQGLVAYSDTWRRHAFMFAALADGPLSGLAEPDRAARNLVVVLISAAALGFAVRAKPNGDDLPGICLAITAVLLFLSPTGYPWYQIWIAMFLPFAPRWGLLSLMVTAPLYYTRFLLGDAHSLYQWGIVPIAFGVPLLLVLAEAFWRRDYART